MSSFQYPGPRFGVFGRGGGEFERDAIVVRVWEEFYCARCGCMENVLCKVGTINADSYRQVRTKPGARSCQGVVFLEDIDQIIKVCVRKCREAKPEVPVYGLPPNLFIWGFSMQLKISYQEYLKCGLTISVSTLSLSF